MQERREVQVLPFQCVLSGYGFSTSKPQSLIKIHTNVNQGQRSELGETFFLEIRQQLEAQAEVMKMM